MVSYGWTIDYINDYVTIPQIQYLMDTISQHPPLALMNFGKSAQNDEDKLLKQLDGLGDKVRVDRWANKPSVKSVTRLKDKAVIK